MKDGINEAVVNGRADHVNQQSGSKLAGHAHATVQPGAAFTIEVRFSAEPRADPFADFEAVFARRLAETDTFYDALHPVSLNADEQLIQRQSFAGLLWSKQFFHCDVFRWLQGDPTQPTPPGSRWRGRNRNCKELNNSDLILMPDTWEYPWYASWDLAFHCVAPAHVDPAFAKDQPRLMGREWYQHASGQYPAYEWNFDDVNPPVLSWAAWRADQIEQDQSGTGDIDFLTEVF